ncbi:hypothetical protein L228DRAFT_247309 [Xylona heveae TC161]|uniref:C2H2-type domain-containing protein n=1 Tax=Xylona heveae (strain CBS 132557 / TC161) TaxID=1328760 RepID=A0A165H2F0_XYLHT|nr:hypothetical protein L228DRAFT_247309 [Xylona heveae TC161]KZF22894.1 hypothetical protein L228DRAFT_247309 [Xylona heveae TC161]
MIIHLESGNCPSGMNCDRLIDIAAECFQSKKYMVKGLSRERRLSIDSDLSEYRDYYDEFYECPYCGKSFPHGLSLKQHLESTAHRPYIFKCPDRDCGVTFNSVSGLVQHVESDRCDEGIRSGTGSIQKMLRWLFLQT